MHMLGEISSLKVELETTKVWYLLLAALHLLVRAVSRHAAVFQKSSPHTDQSSFAH